MNILLVTSSPRGEASTSTRVARTLAQELLGQHPGALLTERNVNQSPLPFINEAFVNSIHVPAESQTPEQLQALDLSNRLVQELIQADYVIIASGMINFGVPAALKAWIDLITRAGLTFSYGSGGPEGLLKGKKTYLVLASGGVYSDGPMAAMDFQRPYLLSVLGFLGLTDVEMVIAEGTMMGPEGGERALASALAQVARISAGAGNAALAVA